MSRLIHCCPDLRRRMQRAIVAIYGKLARAKTSRALFNLSPMEEGHATGRLGHRAQMIRPFSRQESAKIAETPRLDNGQR